MVIKYRNPVLGNLGVVKRLKEIFASLQKELDIKILSKGRPKTDLVKVVKYLKAVSSRYIREEFPEIRTHLWGKSLWSNSYFMATTGEFNLDVLKKYVESQGGKNKTGIDSEN